MSAPDPHPSVAEPPRVKPPPGWKWAPRGKDYRPFKQNASLAENARSILATGCFLLGLGTITIGGLVVSGLSFFHWIIGFPLMLAIAGGLVMLGQLLTPERAEK